VDHVIGALANHLQDVYVHHKIAKGMRDALMP
jgi:hypothetical protein